MTINLTLPSSWKSTISGLVAAVGLFLTSYTQEGNHINLKSPLFWSALASAVWAWYTKDKDVTGGTKANSTNSPEIVAQTSTKP